MSEEHKLPNRKPDFIFLLGASHQMNGYQHKDHFVLSLFGKDKTKEGIVYSQQGIFNTLPLRESFENSEHERIRRVVFYGLLTHFENN